MVASAPGLPAASGGWKITKNRKSMSREDDKAQERSVIEEVREEGQKKKEGRKGEARRRGVAAEGEWYRMAQGGDDCIGGEVGLSDLTRLGESKTRV